MLCMFLTVIIACTFLVELEVHRGKFGFYMMTRVMEDAQVYDIHEEYIKGLDVIMGNDEIESNGRRDRHEPFTMRIMHREV
jgi:hypothetical protein